MEDGRSRCPFNPEYKSTAIIVGEYSAPTSTLYCHVKVASAGVFFPGNRPLAETQSAGLCPKSCLVSDYTARLDSPVFKCWLSVFLAVRFSQIWICTFYICFSVREGACLVWVKVFISSCPLGPCRPLCGTTVHSPTCVSHADCLHRIHRFPHIDSALVGHALDNKMDACFEERLWRWSATHTL